MSEWIVYSKDGLTERCRLKRLEYNGSFMNERTISATFEYHSEVAFDVFDYIVYRNEKFELESIPSVKKISNHNYEYELRFVSLKYELERCEMRDIVPKDNGVTYPTPLTFSFTGDVRYLTERIQANLDSLYGEGVWSIVIPEGVKSEEKNITISQQNCWNALSLVNTTYNLTFSIKGRVITVGGEQSLVGHVFQYGKGKGLYEIERVSDTDTGIVTKVRAYGGTRNLDYSYPKRPEWTDSVLPVSFALSPLRLMLPSFKLDGKTDYVLADDSIINEYGIREASVVYDDIYPSITGMLNYDDEPIDEIKSVDEVDDSKDTFVVYLYDLGFDLESNLTTENAQISMKSGSLIGYTFNISEIEKQEDNSYKITLGRITNEEGDTGNFNIPNSQWSIAAGDKFVLLNILMPQEYIRNAEERLLERAKEYLNEYGRTNFSYNVGLHDKFLKENANIYEELIEGSKLRIYDQNLGISEDVTIQSITITENMGDNMLTQVKVTLNNKPSASTIERIQGQIKELSETSAGQFSTQSELLKQYRRKLDKPFFDRLFAAVDINGNEIPSTDLSTPIAYIKARYSVASIGGFTMYLNDNSYDLPSIYDGLPIDNNTIYWEDVDGSKVLKAKGGGGIAESVSWADITGKPEWLLDGKISYSEIEGTPDLTQYALVSQIPSLSGYATEQWVKDRGYATADDLDSRINSLIDGAPAAYDTLKEIADVLSGNVDSIGDIITTLGTKWTQDNTKIANWDAAFSWGNHANVGYAKKIDIEGKYVTIAGNEDITGLHNFTNGFKVGGNKIYESKDGIIYIDANLVVKGGVTMYGDEKADVPSIYDGLPIDGVTIYWEKGILKAKGGGGVAESVSWADITGKPTTLSGYGITKANIKSTLGISDWALASSKPSYEWDDILGRPTLLSSFTDDVVAGKYLPLTGGVIDGWVDIRNNKLYEGTLRITGVSTKPIIRFDGDFSWGYLGFGGANNPCYYDNSLNEYNLIHSGNIGSYALPLSGGTLVSTGRETLLLRSSSSYGPVLDLQDSKGNIISEIGHIPSNAANYAYGAFWTNIESKVGFVLGNDGIAYVTTNPNTLSPKYTIWHEGNFTPANYLPLSGGVMTGSVRINWDSTSGSGIYGNDKNLFLIGDQLQRRSLSGTFYDIIDSGNIGSQSVSYATSAGNANALDNMDSTDFFRILGTNVNLDEFGDNSDKNGIVYINSSHGEALNAPFSYGSVLSINHQAASWMIGCQSNGELKYRHRWWSASGVNWSDWKTIAFTDSNVASADYASSAGNAEKVAGLPVTSGNNKPWNSIPAITPVGWMDVGRQFEFHYDNTTGSDYSTILRCTGNYSNIVNLPSESGTLALLTDNVASATKLQTARTIWGQSFDGTGDVNGILTINSGGYIKAKDGYGYDRDVLELSSDNTFYLGYGSAGAGGDTYLHGNNIMFRCDTSRTERMRITPSGNVLIGTSTDSSSGKLQINGGVTLNGYMEKGAVSKVADLGEKGLVVSTNTARSHWGMALWTEGDGNGYIQQQSFGSATTYSLCLNPFGGNVGIGTTNPLDKLHVAGNLRLKNNDSYYGNYIYFGDDKYCYIGEITDDSMTIYASKGIQLMGKVNITSDTTIDGNLLVRGGITMYKTDGNVTPFLIDVQDWELIDSISVTQVYTAHVTTLLKEKVKEFGEDVTELSESLDSKIRTIKTALQNITSSSSVSAIGAALNTLYNSL